MKSRIAISLMLLIPALEGMAQQGGQTLQGKVSYITSSNVYVKFENTVAISSGDTLMIYREGRLVPGLVVTNKSSISCVAVPVGKATFKIGDAVSWQSKKLTGKPPMSEIKTDPVSIQKPVEDRNRERARGGISAASYSTLSDTHGNDTKLMYRFSLYAPRISGSKFSFDSYMNYRQTFVTTDSGRAHLKDVFNIYNLAIQFDASPTMTFVLGRKINQKISSVGAIDGLQGEKYFGNFYVGILAGFRPDITDYRFNSDLLQYGGYVGIRSNANLISSMTTLGFLEQTNNGEVDRRYGYFQHSSSIGSKLNVFSSLELDLYNQVNADSAGSPRLTNLYVLVSYRISRKVDLSMAYNTQRRVLYYETLKTEIERLLEDDIARQGLRASVNIRPAKYITIGGSYSKRFQANDLNKSDNINAYFSLSRIPAAGGRLYVNYNNNSTSYSRSNIASIRHARNIIDKRLDGDIYYRFVSYFYMDSEKSVRQQYFGASLSWQIIEKLTFDVLGEYATLSINQDNYRVNVRLTRNF